MLAMRVLFCSSLFKVCSCVSELLMLAMRVLFFFVSEMEKTDHARFAHYARINSLYLFVSIL